LTIFLKGSIIKVQKRKEMKKMNIKFDNNPISTVCFRDILRGECFAIDFNTPNQLICMKTYNYDTNDSVNAIDLRDGEKYNFSNDTEVVPLNAELKVWIDIRG